MFDINSKLNEIYNELSFLNSDDMDISLDKFLVALDYSIFICKDDDCKLRLEALKSKISSLSLEDWNILKSFIC